MDLVREESPNPKEGIKAPLDENLRKASKQQIQEEEEDPLVPQVTLERVVGQEVVEWNRGIIRLRDDCTLSPPAGHSPWQ